MLLAFPEPLQSFLDDLRWTHIPVVISEFILQLDEYPLGRSHSPMKKCGLLSDKNAAELNCIYATQSSMLKEAENRQNWILDADYQAVDLESKMKVMAYLNKK